MVQNFLSMAIFMFKNTGFMAASTLVRLMASMVLFIALARFFGPEDFGRLFYNFTLASIFLLIPDYGFAPQLLREIGKDPRSVAQIMGRVFVGRLLLSGVMLALVFVYFIAWPERRHDALLFGLLLLSSLLASFGDFFLVAFRGIGKFHEETKIATVSSILHFVLICALAYLGVDLSIVGLGFVISRSLTLLWSWLGYRRVVGQLDLQGQSLTSAIATLRDSFAYAVDAGFTNFFQQVDTLIVNHYLGAASVGVYQAGMRFLQGAMQFSPVLANVYLPAIAGKQGNAQELKGLAFKLNMKLLVLGSLGWAGFALFGGWVSSYIYGGKYHNLMPLWPPIGLLMLVRYVAASQGVLLTAAGAQNVRVWAQMFSLFVLIVTAPLLIARYQLVGMLFALILTAFSLLIIYSVTLIIRKVPTGFNLASFVLAVAVLGCALSLMRI